jgi:hypothetical protein
MRNATIKAEELAVISSYQTLAADKKLKKIIKHLRSSKLRWAHICAHSRIPVKRAEKEPKKF